MRPDGAVELGEAGDLATLVVAGDQVYWASHEDDGTGAYVRRAPRVGGAIVELARVGELGPFDPALAVVGSQVFVTSVHRQPEDPRKQDAVVLQLDGRDAKPFAKAVGVASAGLVGHNGFLYWVAATATGPGSIVSTRVSDGRTRTLVPCPAADADCGELVPGTPPVAVILDDLSRDPVLHRLGPDVARRGVATVPVGLDAIAVLGNHVLCTPVYSDGDSPPSPVLVPLAGGAPVPVEGMGAGTMLVDGRYYHVTDAGLMRRTSPTGTDELLVTRARAFTASADGIAWVEDGIVWASPLPP